MIFGGRKRPTVDVVAGEQVLASAMSGDDVAAGTREALYLPDGTRLPWHLVEAADWDLESETLTVLEVGTYGHLRPEHRCTLADPRRLLQLVRERVTASIVLTRHVPLVGRQGVKVIGRRPTPSGPALAWYVEYDAGLDPEDPLVAAAVSDALVAARAEVGET